MKNKEVIKKRNILTGEKKNLTVVELCENLYRMFEVNNAMFRHKHMYKENQ